MSKESHVVEGMTRFMRPGVFDQLINRSESNTGEENTAATDPGIIFDDLADHTIKCPEARRASINRFAIHKKNDIGSHLEKLREKFGEAAHLEHVLMLSYLYSAYSIKSRWEEFAYIYNEETNEWVPNERAPVHFEACREWQGQIINVSKEEMMHLNFVNMLARAVGCAPNFQLPNGSFPHTFSNWKPDGINPVTVELRPLSKRVVMDFVHSESTSDLGAIIANPQHPQHESAIQYLQQTENLDLQCKAFYGLGAANLEDSAVIKLISFYQYPIRGLAADRNNINEDGNMKIDEEFAKICIESCKEQQEHHRSLESVKLAVPSKQESEEATSNIRPSVDTFTSLTEFYDQLLATVEKAVRAGVIGNPHDENLEDNEVLTPRTKKGSKIIHKSGEEEREILKNLQLAFLPTERPPNLSGTKLTKTFDEEQHFHMSTFREVIDIITEQGEGSKDFSFISEKMLGKRYTTTMIYKLLQISTDDLSRFTFPDEEITETPKEDNTDHIEDCIVWNSHLSVFSRIFVKMARLDIQAKRMNVPVYAAARVKATNVPSIMLDHLVTRFNELYLVMRTWLHQMYLIYEVTDERCASSAAVSTIVCWGLMSQTIRPMLELISFVEHDTTTLFQDPEPNNVYLELLYNVIHSTSPKAKKLEEKGFDSENVNKAAFFVLKRISKWARKCATEIHGPKGDNIVWNGTHPKFNPNAMARGMMFRRLSGIARCTGELILQIPFRIAKGRSGIACIERLDDPDVYKFSENLRFNRYMLNTEKILAEGTDPEKKIIFPTIGDPNQRRFVYSKGQKLLRVQFSGWILNQLATDNDCNMNEIGYLGTFFSRFGEAPFDRRYVWTDSDWQMFGEQDRGTFYKTCRRYLGELEDGTEDCTPKPKVEVKSGTLFTLEEDLKNISYGELFLDSENEFVKGSNMPVELEEGLQVALREVNGRGPYNVGENHLIWQDGEPIDPFKIAIVRKAKESTDGERVLPYETVIHRSVKNSGNFADFTPQQRAVAGRDPKFTNVELASKRHPWSLDKRWSQSRQEEPWTHRLPNLQKKLRKILEEGKVGEFDADQVRHIVEMVERSRILYIRGSPKKTPFPAAGGNTLYRWRNGYCLYSHSVSGEIQGDQYLDFVQNEKLMVDGDKPWVARYALGVCDADAGGLIHVLGEIYIPVSTNCQ